MKKRTNKQDDKRIICAISALIVSRTFWGSAISVLADNQEIKDREVLSGYNACVAENSVVVEVDDFEEFDAAFFEEIFDEFEDEIPEDEEIFDEGDMSEFEEEIPEDEEVFENETSEECYVSYDDDNSESESENRYDDNGRTTLAEISEDSDTEERIFAVMDYLVSEGFSTAAAAAIVGNMAVESQFNPSLISEADYYGLFQWNTSESGNYWWNKVKKWLKANGYEWDSFEGQVKAFVHCENKGLLTEERFEKLKTLGNVAEATELIAVYYESCVGGSDKTEYYRVGTCYQGLETRKSEAWIAYTMYHDGTEYCGEKPYNEK